MGRWAPRHHPQCRSIFSLAMFDSSMAQTFTYSCRWGFKNFRWILSKKFKDCCWDVGKPCKVFCFVGQCLWPCNQHLGWLEVLTCSTYGWTTALYWGAISSSTTRAVALGNQAKLSFLLDCLTSVAQPTMSEQHAGGWRGTRLLFWQFSRLDALMLTWETKMQINFRLRDHF